MISPAAEAFASAAEALTGSPFRLHGRCPQQGLDCIGLALCALKASGRRAIAPGGYALRNIDIAHHIRFARHNGFDPASGEVLRGDLLLVEPGPAQHHVLIALSPSAFVHAHAGMRRVVREPGPMAWPLLRHWRLPSTQ